MAFISVVTPNYGILLKMKTETIIEVLRETPPNFIAFRKTDGTLRGMWATLNKDYLPPPVPPKEGEESKPKKSVAVGVVTVYEMGVGWRSFKIENLISLATFATPDAYEYALSSMEVVAKQVESIFEDKPIIIGTEL